MKSPISGILKRFSQVFQRAVDAVALCVSDNLDEDGDVKAVVEQAWLTYKISDVFMDAVRQAVKEACEAGYGQTIPLLPSQLEEAWDASGMTLSKKLHGADKEMRARVVSTIKDQLKQNRHAIQAARQLYDGYRSGQAVVRRQEMPKYLQDIVNFARRSDLTAADRAQMLQLVRRACRQVTLIGEYGAPNTALKTAYSELLNAVADGSEKALDRAVHVALEEKSRYVAERIVRTEAARAWADGFHARYDTDDDVAAYKWTLSSRHPHYDICDMYAQANLWGLGPGIFPKDKTPALPVHPHCLCHLSLVYVTEIDTSRQRNHIKDGGDAYLKRQSHAKRCHLLGIDGAHAWEQGRADWREYMRNWSDDTGISRFHVLPNYGQAVIPDGKIFKYALNPDHPKGKYKAIAFQKALGYNLSNGNELIENVRRHLPIVLAVPNGKSSYGNKYFADMILVGPNGKSAKVRTCWQFDNGESAPRLTSIYVKD